MPCKVGLRQLCVIFWWNNWDYERNKKINCWNHKIEITNLNLQQLPWLPVDYNGNLYYIIELRRPWRKIIITQWLVSLTPWLGLAYTQPTSTTHAIDSNYTSLYCMYSCYINPLTAASRLANVNLEVPVYRLAAFKGPRKLSKILNFNRENCLAFYK